jgi:hypothetical protein
MLDFEALGTGRISYDQLVVDLTIGDLRQLTNEMIDAMLAVIENCIDADVIFQPIDPEADDPYAEAADEVEMAWTLGHVIVHATASAEESAALATELARGVEMHGRSRSEVSWLSVTTIAQCRQRLEESRRMRLASLNMWPDHPYLDNRYQPWPSAPAVNAVGRFVLGLRHDHAHLGQIADVVGQAVAARSVVIA